MKFYKILFLSTAFISFSCKTTTEKEMAYTNPADYNQYLAADSKKSYNAAVSEKDFWSQRLDEDSTGIGDLGPLARSYSKMFETGGNVEDLHNAEKLLLKGNQYAAVNYKDGFQRSLAHNYISQHRFKEAQNILEESYAGVSNKHETEKMLFDAYMETGDYVKAKQMLEKIEDIDDYNYLIRVAKWSDHNGDLEAAIRYLEKARTTIEATQNPELKQWIYSNIADFYGHDGNIKASYEHYLKTLAIQPDNAYAKKGIAWILYSKERNTKEANRILDTLIKQHPIPDYYLLKSEIAAFEGDETASKKYASTFLEKANNPAYGAMYNAYKIELYADENPKMALELAQTEVNNRATPEAYHLLALAQLKNGMKEEALKTIENHVEGKTYEPMALYHSALVYKANNKADKLAPIKEELLETEYEMGPVLYAEIERL